MKFVCALYFNAFVIYNSCNYRKTEGKPSLCTLVNKKKIKKNLDWWDTSNIHSYCIFFFFCIQEFIKIPQTGVTSKLQLVSSGENEAWTCWQALPSLSLTRPWGNEDAPNEINQIFRPTDHWLCDSERESEVMQPANVKSDPRAKSCCAGGFVNWQSSACNWGRKSRQWNLAGMTEPQYCSCWH